MPLISVIMGVYNCKNEELLKNSVQSILDQTISDFEIIICNDGSTDSQTLKMLKSLETIDDRIKILSYDKNRGLAYALNFCIKNSNGIFIARQDDDDISLPERFEKQITFLNTHPDFAMVGTIADVYDDNGVWGEFLVDEVPTKSSFFWNSPFLHPSMLIRKECLLAVDGYRVSKETRRCEDYDLFMRMYANNMKGYNIQEKLYKYRIEITNKKYRPMKYRIDEAVVRLKGFKVMGVLGKGIPYIVKPIIIGLIPQVIFKKIRKKQYDKH